MVIMSQTNDQYLEEKTIDALRLAKQDWAEASRLLCKWVEEDHKLLLALTAKYLRGAAAHSVENVAKRLAPQQTPQNKNTASPITHVPPKTPIAGNDPSLTTSIWDTIITQMQEMPDLDAEQHAKALRTIAKAFVAKRFDALDEQKGRYGRH
jgi:hypothetical protein